MKIYIVMLDSTEYHEGEFYPIAAFTDNEWADKCKTVHTCIWGNGYIEEVDIEAKTRAALVIV